MPSECLMPDRRSAALVRHLVSWLGRRRQKGGTAGIAETVEQPPEQGDNETPSRHWEGVSADCDRQLGHRPIARIVSQRREPTQSPWSAQAEALVAALSSRRRKEK